MSAIIPNPPSPPKPARRLRARLLFAAAAFATLVALFYAVENWRGRRAWEAYRTALLAKGEKLDWSEYTKPPIPDQQNFLKAPLMDGWFNRATTNKADAERIIRVPGWILPPPSMAALRSWDTYGSPNGPEAKGLPAPRDRAATPAAEVIRWFERYDTEFKALSAAAERPLARLDGAFDAPWSEKTLSFISVRRVSQALSTQAKAYLLVGRPQEAVHDLRLLRRIMDLEIAAPPTLVSAMIRVAVGGLYVEMVADGWKAGLWQEPQWIEIDEQLRPVHFVADLADSFRGGERAGILKIFEHYDRDRLAKLFVFNNTGGGAKLMTSEGFYIHFAPRGWFYQNELLGARIYQSALDDLDTANDRLSPSQLNRDTRWGVQSIERANPYNIVVRSCMPNFEKVTMRVAKFQTVLNQARIVCALERHKKAAGQYPENLDALVPAFIGRLPREIVNGQPMKYHRNNDGSFLLYSVGWDEKDDGGSTAKDWLWPDAVSN